MSSARAEVISSLESLGVPFELIRIDPAYADTVAFCEEYGYPPEKSCNTIIVRNVSS